MRGGRALILTVVIGALMLTPVAGATTTQAELVTLTVSVSDSNGDPVGGAELTATWGNGSTTATTASNGKAFVDVQQGADVTIEVEHPEYVRNFPQVVRDATERDVSLEVAQKAEAAITVTTPQGASITDVVVTVSQDGRIVANGRTGSSGTFETGVVEAGEYLVEVVKPGYFSNESEVTVRNTTETTLQIRQGTVLLDVTVEDDHFDPPERVENVTIGVGDVATVSAANGQSGVTVPVNDEYTVTAEKENYTTAEERVSIGESARNVTLVINREPSLTVEPANRRVVVGESLRLTVRDEYDEAVPNATVSLNGAEVATTDDEGVASVRIEAAGTNEIRATKGGLTSADLNVTGVREDGTTPTRTATETATATATTTTEGVGPGFGLLAALAALGGALLVRRAV